MLSIACMPGTSGRVWMCRSLAHEPESCSIVYAESGKSSARLRARVRVTGRSPQTMRAERATAGKCSKAV